MRKWNTVRNEYLYICGGSLLLSGGMVFVVRSAAAFFYTRHTPDSVTFLVRLHHWMINHIGRTPMELLLFVILFTSIFLIRSQKLSDDLTMLLRASEAITANVPFHELTVLSRGELGQLADNLLKINRVKRTKTADEAVLEAADQSEVPPGSEDIMALILRVRALLHLLEGLEREIGMQQQVEEAKREAAGMERFLENLMAQP
ncbi:hypothetical protein [Paenibacillus sp. HW567]|uniref:hypothetical protein n=1 Tax=Paenibacillus sp. HW567 TaxID=1034769 RepID=UPI0012EB8D70|nr:hypothetical protein [Paenibacillus sp. HW567]